MMIDYTENLHELTVKILKTNYGYLSWDVAVTNWLIKKISKFRTMDKITHKDIAEALQVDRYLED